MSERFLFRTGVIRGYEGVSDATGSRIIFALDSANDRGVHTLLIHLNKELEADIELLPAGEKPKTFFPEPQRKGFMHRRYAVWDLGKAPVVAHPLQNQ